ncbi:MAG: SGNH/GDSL hydrolase family protein [Spirochaetales bacterium]|nr:SGNH/GDSL hydrolase family protein [Spirochaetales bacterium]
MELKGKTIDFLGDSLTEGLYLKDNGNRYDNYIARTCGLKKANNYGIGGTRIAFQSRPSEKAKHDLDFCGRCYLMDPDADIIVVFGGTNDYGHGDAPFGKIGDKERTTFCGAVDYLINKIRELYPSAKLVMVTPGHRFDDATTPPIDKYQRLGIEGRQLEDYVDAMVRIAKSYDVPILNLLEKLDIDPKKPEDREKYTRDGLHYNDLGHVKLGECVAQFLKSL